MTREEVVRALDNQTVGQILEGRCTYVNGNRVSINFVMAQAIEMLSKEPCDDCISREKAISMVDGAYYNSDTFGEYRDLTKELLGDLPSVQPTRKKGRWTDLRENSGTEACQCSVCQWIGTMYEDDVNGMPYCPNCGSEMEEEE